MTRSFALLAVVVGLALSIVGNASATVAPPHHPVCFTTLCSHAPLGHPSHGPIS